MATKKWPPDQYTVSSGRNKLGVSRREVGWFLTRRGRVLPHHVEGNRPGYLNEMPRPSASLVEIP